VWCGWRVETRGWGTQRGAAPGGAAGLRTQHARRRHAQPHAAPRARTQLTAARCCPAAAAARARATRETSRPPWAGTGPTAGAVLLVRVGLAQQGSGTGRAGTGRHVLGQRAHLRTGAAFDEEQQLARRPQCRHMDVTMPTVSQPPPPTPCWPPAQRQRSAPRSACRASSGSCETRCGWP
jgi:hypothetical protein